MKFIKLSLILLAVSSFPLVGNAQILDKLIKIGLTNNPDIQKFELQYNIALEKKVEAYNVPNTEFALGYFVSEPETRTGSQRFKVSAKQLLPWFGTITSRENYTNTLADAAYEDIAIAKRKLVASVSQSYYELYEKRAKQAIVVQNIELLSTFKTMILTQIETGTASAVDILRLQMRENNLEQLKATLEQQFLAEQSAMNALLNRPLNTSIKVVSNLTLPLETEAYLNQTLQLHPELLKYDKLYQSVEQSELLNQKEKSPMLGFGVEYINVEERPGMTFIDNGKDIIMPMLSVSIPIFNNKYSSISKQNKLKQQQIETEKQARLNTLQTLLNNAIHTRNAARIQFQTLDKNIEQAKNAEDILLKNYESGTIDFNDVLEIQELQLKFQLNQIEAVKVYYVQSTVINYLVQ